MILEYESYQIGPWICIITEEPGTRMPVYGVHVSSSKGNSGTILVDEGGFDSPSTARMFLLEILNKLTKEGSEK